MAARAILPDDLDPQSRRQRQMDDAWLADLALIRELTRQEQQAEQDRLFAARLAGIEIAIEPDERRNMAMLLNDDDDDEDGRRSNETTREMPQMPRAASGINTTVSNLTFNADKKKSDSGLEKPKKCAACLDLTERNDPFVPCGHVYHLSCLQELFMAATKDESLMPPRCCTHPIPINLAKLKSEDQKLFDAKQLEYSTVNRLYCHLPTCSTFIPPSSIMQDIGTCPKKTCGAQTCSMCKAAAHVNADCPQDTATAAVLATAREAGWSRCYRCGTVVELTVGCYHMTCRCRAEFCYLCKTPWKNCSCAQWDEQRLLTEARVRTARILENERQPARPAQDVNQFLHRVINELRNNAECRHDGRWIYTPGAGRCEECHHFLRQYLFRCYRCQLMACNRCRRNRF